MKKLNKTKQYYEEKAVEFATKTFELEVSEHLKQWCRSLPQGARVLDVGCGSGRDAKFMKEQGLNPVAIEPSQALAQWAQQATGLTVQCMRLEDLKDKDFDAVWCSASLLHHPKEQLKKALSKIHSILKDDGWFAASFKQGYGEATDENERFFAYYQKDEMEEILSQAGFKNIQCLASSDGLGRSTVWLNFTSRRQAMNEIPVMTKKKSLR